jgi:hypothetical protein
MTGTGLQRYAGGFVALLALEGFAFAGSNECVTRIPAGAAIATMVTSSPKEINAGYRLEVRLRLTHQKGEQVLAPDLSAGGPVDLAVRAADFATERPPTQPAAPVVLERISDTETTVVIPLVALPKQAGSLSATLPPFPVEIARGRGDRLHLCTEARAITVLDPTGNEIDPRPRENPAPLPQREPWALMRRALYVAAAALVLAAGFAHYSRRRRAVKAQEPIAPKTPPWQRALRELRELERALPHETQLESAFDRASEVVREYLGIRFAFDGLGSTSEDVQHQLSAQPLSSETRADLANFFAATDLVKFAAATTSRADCQVALRLGVAIVQATTPAPSPQAPEGGPKSAEPTSSPLPQRGDAQ